MRIHLAGLCVLFYMICVSTQRAQARPASGAVWAVEKQIRDGSEKRDKTAHRYSLKSEQQPATQEFSLDKLSNLPSSQGRARNREKNTVHSLGFGYGEGRMVDGMQKLLTTPMQQVGKGAVTKQVRRLMNKQQKHKKKANVIGSITESAEKQGENWNRNSEKLTYSAFKEVQQTEPSASMWQDLRRPTYFKGAVWARGWQLRNNNKKENEKTVSNSVKIENRSVQENEKRRLSKREADSQDGKRDSTSPLIWVLVSAVTFLLCTVSVVAGWTCRGCKLEGSFLPRQPNEDTEEWRQAVKEAVREARRATTVEARYQMDAINERLYSIGVRADKVMMSINSMEMAELNRNTQVVPFEAIAGPVEYPVQEYLRQLPREETQRVQLPNVPDDNESNMSLMVVGNVNTRRPMTAPPRCPYRQLTPKAPDIEEASDEEMILEEANEFP